MQLFALATLLLTFSYVLLGQSSVIADTPITPTPYNTFVSKAFNAGLRYVNNSGVCETTPGVHTASGYIDIAQNQSLVRRYTPEKHINPLGTVVLVLCCTRKSWDCSFHTMVSYVPSPTIAFNSLVFFQAKRRSRLFLHDWAFPRLAFIWETPLETWLTLFPENGPCQVNPDGKTTVLNPFRCDRQLLSEYRLTALQLEQR